MIGRRIVAVPLDVTSKIADPASGVLRTQNADFYSFCQPGEVLRDSTPTLHERRARVGSDGQPRPLGYQPQERQECACFGRPGSDVASISGCD